MVGRFGQFKVTNVELGRLGDLDEQDLDTDLELQFDLDSTRALHAEARLDANSSQRDPEGLHVEGRTHTQRELVIRVAVGAGRHDRLNPELGGTEHAEPAGPKLQTTFEGHVEVAPAIDPTEGIDGQDAEEVDASVEVKAPFAVGHNNGEACVEGQYLEQRDLAIQRELERVGTNTFSGGVSGVELKHTFGLDEQHCNVGFDRDTQTKDKARIAAAVDRCDTVEHELEWPKGE